MEEKVRFVNDRGHEDVQKCKGPALPRVRVSESLWTKETPSHLLRKQEALSLEPVSQVRPYRATNKETLTIILMTVRTSVVSDMVYLHAMRSPGNSFVSEVIKYKHKSQ